MGCGCKNKQNVQENIPQQNVPVQNQNTQAIKETIKKTVEKYYSKNNPQ
jgi:hypothetical protein